MKVVGYTRTSWEEQRHKTYASVGEQELRLRDFARRTGLRLDEVHCDTGLSPKHGTCAGLVSILDDMDGDWDAVLVTSLDRLRGISTVSVEALEELRDNGKRVLVVSEATAVQLQREAPVRPAPEPKLPTHTTPSGAARRRIAERLLKGREAGARAGKHQSGPAPYGYRRDYARRGHEGVMLVPDDHEAEVVRMIFREYLRLRSMKRLIKLLDEQGLRTRRGKRWSRAGVSWILKNDTYVGRVHFGKIRARGKHDSIVPPIVFNKVQKLIRHNNKRKGELELDEVEVAAQAAAPPVRVKPAPVAVSGTTPRPTPELARTVQRTPVEAEVACAS